VDQSSPIFIERDDGFWLITCFSNFGYLG